MLKLHVSYITHLAVALQHIDPTGVPSGIYLYGRRYRC